MSTTRTEQPGRAGRLALALAGLAAGCALVVMAAPILAGAAAALPGDGAVRALRHREPITEDALYTIIESRANALDRYDALDWRRELATASIIPRDGRPASRESLDRGIRHTRAALEAAPASPQDWLRLAILESLSGENGKAVGHLSTALLTGADMPRLRPQVLDLAFVLWRDLSDDTKTATLGVLRHAWQAGNRNDKLALLRLARARGFLPLAVLTLSQEDGLQEELQQI